MTGMEHIQDRPAVAQYLGTTRQTLGHLMPGWGSWERPHVINRRGGIAPIWEERLLEKARRFCRLWSWIRGFRGGKLTRKRLRALRRRASLFYR
jgi:hypothetical protein